MKFLRFSIVVFLAQAIGGCATAIPDDADLITWYAVNTGGTLRVTMYDIVCDQQIANLRLSSRRETAVTSCADENGRAYIRYRARGYASRMGSWTYNRIGDNQRVYIQ
ncbi:MAG: hypothetical protein KJN90_10875 [Gammaproteobacteria bacterium]|nr:hypothetical protein [Gammaproteobacteria bacterium]